MDSNFKDLFKNIVKNDNAFVEIDSIRWYYSYQIIKSRDNLKNISNIILFNASNKPFGTGGNISIIAKVAILLEEIDDDLYQVTTWIVNPDPEISYGNKTVPVRVKRDTLAKEVNLTKDQLYNEIAKQFTDIKYNVLDQIVKTKVAKKIIDSSVEKKESLSTRLENLIEDIRR